MRARAAHVVLRFFACLFLSMNVGCRQPAVPARAPADANNHSEGPSAHACYVPTKVDIMPLTELVTPGGTRGSQVRLYVSLLDTFGSQVKAPAVFRFELYEYVQRSAQPKGKRALIWADIDLTDPTVNNGYWRDFLRAYEFSLPFEPTAAQTYILQVTCLCPNGSRLSAEFALKYAK